MIVDTHYMAALDLLVPPASSAWDLRQNACNMCGVLGRAVPGFISRLSW
jgi:hypothetical protein